MYALFLPLLHFDDSFSPVAILTICNVFASVADDLHPLLRQFIDAILPEFLLLVVEGMVQPGLEGFLGVEIFIWWSNGWLLSGIYGSLPGQGLENVLVNEYK